MRDAWNMCVNIYRHYDEIGVYQTREQNVNKSISIEQLHMILYVQSYRPSHGPFSSWVAPVSSNASFLSFLISSNLQYIPYENEIWWI